MGRKGSWFSSVKKALSPSSKSKRNKNVDRSKDLFENEKPSISNYSNPAIVEVSHPQVSHPRPAPPLEDDVKFIEEENEQEHAYTVAVATAAAAEAAVAAAQAAAEVVRLTSVNKFAGMSKEEAAAIRIQTAFRGHLARRALRALRGLVRLKSLVDGPTVKRQTANTLKHMQTLSRVHSQIQSRRIRMSEENRALQRQILQKRAKELEGLRMGDEWNDSIQSKEQIEANLLHKYEAAMKRERALAYSYTHQQTWKKSARTTNLLFMDPTNPQWGWSWLERWMAARPWESQAEKDLNSDRASIKSTGLGTSTGEITKSFARHQLNADSPSSPTSQKPSKPPSPMASRKMKPASPRGSVMSQDDDSRSVLSVQSNRRHTIAGSSVRDDESLGSSASVPSYMAPTRSAKAKSKLGTPTGIENGNGLPGPAKKRLSYPPSPARPRRHSGPPKVENSTIVENNINGVVN